MRLLKQATAFIGSASAFLLCMAATASGGLNSGAVTWLDWSPSAARPTGVEGWSVDRTQLPADTFSVYVRLEGVQSARAVALDLRWWSQWDQNDYTPLSQSQVPACTDRQVYPVGHPSLPPDTFCVYPSPSASVGRISMPIRFMRTAQADTVIPAEFRIARVMVEDSLGAIDTLQVLGWATVRSGRGVLSPGLALFAHEDTPPLALRSHPYSVAVAARSFELEGPFPSTPHQVALLRPGQPMVPGDALEPLPGSAGIRFAIPQGVLVPGPYDLMYTLDSGASDTLANALLYAPLPAYFDTVAIGLDPPQLLPQDAFYCGDRHVKFPPDGTYGGATWPAGWCHLLAPGNTALCDLTSYPSFFSQRALVRQYRSAVYWVDDCFGEPKKNINMTIEVRRSESSGGHCHTSGIPDVGSATGDALGVVCESLNDGSGGYRCYGNTGADGWSFRVKHTWPHTSGVLNVMMFGSYAADPHYGARDTVFRFCSSMYNALSERVAVLTDSLYLTGGSIRHSSGLAGTQDYYNHWNHFARPGMIQALRKAAGLFKAWSDANYSTPNYIAVNDISIEWGGTFDYMATWSPPHFSHSYGWAADIKTNNNCGPSDYYFSKGKMALLALKRILENDFKVLHHTGYNDASCPHFHISLRDHARR